MKLTCVITTRNRRSTLLRTLEHLEKQTALPKHDWEILVVDNASTDGTAAALSQFSHVSVISLEENEGVPARNLALAKARGKFVAFLDDDIHPVGSAISQALSHLARHPKTGAVVGQVVLPDGSTDAPALPAVLMGGASIVRKSVLDQVGGFATEFFRQVADYDMSFRILRAGFRIERFEDLQFAREAPLHHKPSALACRMDLRNNLILCERYLPRQLRRTYRSDWMRRYALLALHDHHKRIANAGIKEAHIWARREAAVGRKPLGTDAAEAIFQLRSQADTVARWARERAIRRVCIADWGKNIFATWQAAKSCGMHVHAVLEASEAFIGASYRRVPVLRDVDADRRRFDGIILSTLNPAQVEQRQTELESRFGVPVLRLWEPQSISVPPPRKVEKAA